MSWGYIRIIFVLNLWSQLSHLLLISSVLTSTRTVLSWGGLVPQAGVFEIIMKYHFYFYLTLDDATIKTNFSKSSGALNYIFQVFFNINCSTQAQASAQLSLSSNIFTWPVNVCSSVCFWHSSQALTQPGQLKFGTSISFRGYMKITINFFS